MLTKPGNHQETIVNLDTEGSLELEVFEKAPLQVKRQQDILFGIGFFTCPGNFIDAQGAVWLAFHSYTFHYKKSSLLPKDTLRILCLTGKN